MEMAWRSGLAALLVLIGCMGAGWDAPMHRKVYAAMVDDGIPIEPDPTITSGATNPDNVDPMLTKRVLCGWGFTTKPLRHVDQAERIQTYKGYGLHWYRDGWCHQGGCQVDHLCPLELGCTNRQSNLWPQPCAGTRWNCHAKDLTENALKKAMCDGKIELADAQHLISTDWIAAWKRFVSPLPPLIDGTEDPDGRT